MAIVTFLEADRPLVKTYRLDSNGNLQKESYPAVADFTSHQVEVHSLSEFREALAAAAAKGWCLLKGELKRTLVHESRAGATDPNGLTTQACLDVDRLQAGVTIDQALAQVGLAHIDRVVQYSASQGIEPGRGDTGHVYINLSQPTHPALLKQWLISLNLKAPCFQSRLELTKTNNAISWPLDISTCQNDKLIYLAPPSLGAGIAPWNGERIQLVERGTKYLDLSTQYIPSAEENRNAMNKCLDALRAARGLEARKWTTTIHKLSGLEVLTKPDQATLTNIKQERGFTYFNLNGGDSWGYFHPNDSPEVIRNFKGEPFYATKDLLPEYWAQLQSKGKGGPSPDAQAPIVLAFRDFRTAVYYNGIWDPRTQKLDLAIAKSELQLQHFLVEHGRPKQETVPVWELTFDPRSETRVNPVQKTVNTFEPSVYMKQNVVEVTNLSDCPVIEKILRNAVSRDETTLDHWLNWLVCVFKERTRTQTSWVLHGIQGTGKGLLVNKILIPLLGNANVAVRRMKELEDRFNGYMASSLLVIIDEAQITESRQSALIMADIKNYVTEPIISIRRMHTMSYTVPNYCNFMFLSNQTAPIQIEATDRRHNVGEFREEKLEITDAETDAIENELPTFANYLMSRIANVEQARTVLFTDDRAEIMAASANSVETTARALLKGNLEFFWDALPAGEPGMLGPEQQALTSAYELLVRRALRESEQRLTRDELRILFAYNIGEIPRSPTKFTSMLRHHRIHLIPIWKNGKTVRGMEVNWTASPDWLQERLSETTN